MLIKNPCGERLVEFQLTMDKFQYSSCVRKPWKMMDHPRDYVTKKGMLEPGG
jgi:hypothetical protein